MDGPCVGHWFPNKFLGSNGVLLGCRGTEVNGSKVNGSVGYNRYNPNIFHL